MSFWGSEKLKRELLKSKVVTSADGAVTAETIVVNGAYELGLGPEAFLTSNDDNTKQVVKDGEQLSIPPGQFGLLLTEEKVTIPNDAIGFISIKAGIKFRGLINVSGFHVDSGFSGRLKFAVYNAGSQNIILERKQPVFLLWLSDLDQSAQPYSGAHAGQERISPDDVMKLQGEIASPSQLKKEIQEMQVKFDREMRELDHKLGNLKFLLGILVALAVSLLGFTLRGCVQRPSDQVQIAAPTNHQPSAASAGTFGGTTTAAGPQSSPATIQTAAPTNHQSSAASSNKFGGTTNAADSQSSPGTK